MQAATEVKINDHQVSLYGRFHKSAQNISIFGASNQQLNDSSH